MRWWSRDVAGSSSDRHHTTRRAELDELAQRLASAERVLVLTGAGISAGSGLPTFRGPGGLYPGSDLPALHRADQLPGSLPALWAFWGPFRAEVTRAEPNPAHRALAAWQRQQHLLGRDFTLVTANVDDLHERAGSTDVGHLHGRLDRTRCLDCTYRLAPDHSEPADVPACPDCGGMLRPDLVLFGEHVDIDAQWAAKRAVRECDTFLAVGTSGVVAPANGLVRYAADVGALTVCVDPADTVSPLFAHHVALPAEEVLPFLLPGPSPSSPPSH